ncbi:MAG: ABC transporter ATP-binding protein [SAR202 cluster bacterium]|jgi:putative spermidine/putrescine transport system ATP-binding protein|nr:ABC transporter ATP-binding protein [SAR202 cluster bacterium]
MAVDGFSLTVQRGEFVSLLGPSGCGKTTLLRLLCGLLTADSGEIIVDGQDMSNVPTNKRDIGLVFQNYALFPHMTVFDNLAFGLRMRKLAKPEIEEKVTRALELIGLPEAFDRSPNQMSGGQQQRVALARALVIEPRLLLMDEPLSNLDAKLRKEMRVETLRIQKRLGITSIYVTHDQEEALTLADRVVVMNEGHIMQIGDPADIYERPENLFVANFIGKINSFQCEVIEGSVPSGDAVVRLDGVGKLRVRCSTHLSVGERVTVAVRPERIQMSNKRHDSGNKEATENCFRATIDTVMYSGPTTGCMLSFGAKKDLMIEEQNYSGPSDYKVGQKVDVHLPVENLLVYRRN